MLCFAPGAGPSRNRTVQEVEEQHPALRTIVLQGTSLTAGRSIYEHICDLEGSFMQVSRVGRDAITILRVIQAAIPRLGGGFMFEVLRCMRISPMLIRLIEALNHDLATDISFAGEGVAAR